MFRQIVIAGLFLSAMPAFAAAKAPVQTVVLTLQNHTFSPAVITVPAGQRIKIDLSNRDATGDDFESEELDVDKEVSPHGRIGFYIGPLKPGTYPFKAELHAATAHGQVVAVAGR